MRQGTGYIFGLIGFCILTFGLCGNQVAFAKHAQEVPEATLSHDEAVDQLENFLEMVGELRSHVDRSQFDLDALLDKLDYDVDNIVQFVRQEIQFEQYPGLLRGAKGTLLSRAGNALDQAVLAASLLGSAGYDVRIARGKLDEVTAKVLVQQIAANVRVDLPAGDQAEFGQITDAILRLLPQSASEGHEQSTLVPVESTEPYLAAGGTARRLLGVLHEHGITLEVDGMLAEVWREAEDYFWIEYRSTASGVWTIAHPAFAAPDVEPANITVVQYLRGEVPAELQHRFRIQAFAGVIQGGTCRAEALMSAWERPVENLIGIPLSYINLPDAIFDSETDFDLGSAALSSDYFYPLLNWEAAGDSAIHKSGLVVPMDAAASAAGRIVLDAYRPKYRRRERARPSGHCRQRGRGRRHRAGCCLARLHADCTRRRGSDVRAQLGENGILRHGTYRRGGREYQPTLRGRPCQYCDGTELHAGGRCLS
jgi:hypothetical protein